MLLDRYWPDQEEALVLLHPDLGVEVLMRTGKVNLLSVSDLLADNIVAEERWNRCVPRWTRSTPGTLMLTEGFYLETGCDA